MYYIQFENVHYTYINVIDWKYIISSLKAFGSLCCHYSQNTYPWRRYPATFEIYWRHSQSSCVNIFHAMSKWKIVLPLFVLICSICTGNFLNTAGSWSAQWSKKGYVQSVNRCMYCFNIFWKTLHLTTLTDCLVHFIASLKSSKASLFNFAVGKDTIQIDQSYLLTKCSIEICDLLWRRPQTIKKMDLGFTEEMIFLMHCY